MIYTIVLPVTKKAWAGRIGASRTSLSRGLAKMKRDRLVTYDSKPVTLLYQPR